MLVTCSHGAFCARSVPGHPGAIEVRAATRDELVRLQRHALPDLRVEEHPSGELPFRAVVASDEWVHALERLVAEIA